MEDNKCSAEVVDRKEGYYWVKEQSSDKHNGRWIIAKWNGSYFEMFGIYGSWHDFDFERVGDIIER